MLKTRKPRSVAAEKQVLSWLKERWRMVGGSWDRDWVSVRAVDESRSGSGGLTSEEDIRKGGKAGF